MSERVQDDVDPIETREWLQAIDAVIHTVGVERARFLMTQLQQRTALSLSAGVTASTTDYVNSLAAEQEPDYPGDLAIERRIRAVIRWNAAMIVLRASKKKLDLGGHIATFQSAATLYEVCQHHFFRAANAQDGGDLVYFQGHSAPGIYARAFVEGRLTATQLDNFRQEVEGQGLPSYPHPRLLPQFWQFPTVSMGLAAVCAIYQARFLKYLQHRQLKETSAQTVYAFLGDGEMNEPESRGALFAAARDKLDNLIFVINCNLQGLDGPVLGNGKIIQELEGEFRGAGWAVIKVIWGSGWDSLLQRDHSGKLIQLMNETLDGDYQTLKSKDGAYVRTHFFGKYPETLALVAEMSDEAIWALNRGGHDPQKLFAAFKQAKSIQDQPVVILAKTIKGYGMGGSAQGQNIVHNVKKMDLVAIRQFYEYFNIPLDPQQIESLPYLTLAHDAAAESYLHARRQALKGYVPTRLAQFTHALPIPALEVFQSLLTEQNREISTTMAFVRVLNVLLKQPTLGPRIVPIIADEARTFGMEGLFRQIGIYNPQGQQYTPSDREQLAYYKEDCQGQVLQEGISELGAGAAWLAAATSYSTNDYPMIPFYIYYSMFGFQRIGDLLWVAGDQQARGFLIGGTAGRTTLNGEGLQHEDGHSHIQALTIPNCRAYDPAYAYEVAVIIQAGLRQMLGEQHNVFYYLTTLNENYQQPAMPAGVEQGICQGIYRLDSLAGAGMRVQLMGSGAILRPVRQAAKILQQEYAIGCDLYSVTSFTELAREGQVCVRWNRLHPTNSPRIPYVAQVLNDAPVVAATDYMKLYAEQIRAYLPTNDYCVLGTDGFGRSDSRENLRRHFEVDAHHVIIAALSLLARRGELPPHTVAEAITRYGLNVEKIDPLYA